jgi:hypothetical protein
MSVVVGPSDGARVPTRPIRKGRFEVFPDDPRESPYPDQLPEQQRVVVIGDLHGDYEALVACLRMSGCVDAADVGRWTAGPGTVMVVLGDVVDRFRAGRCAQPEAWGCHDSEWVAASGMFLTKSVGETQDEEKRVLRLLNSLASQAQGRGTYLYRLVGNHEEMQTHPDNDFGAQRTYASPFAVGGGALEDYQERWKSFYEGEFHRLVGEHRPKVALKVGSHVFCHGGFNAQCVRAATELATTNFPGMNIIQLANAAFDERWRNIPEQRYGVVYEHIVRACGPSRGGKADFSGLLWDDSLSSTDTPEEACSRTTYEVLRLLRQNFALSNWTPAEHIVISHCIQFDRNQEHTAGDLPAREVRRAEYTDFTTAPDAGFSKTRGDNRTVNALCEGLVWRMDVGMSRAFAYKAAAAYRLTPGLERSTRPAILLIDVKDGGGYDYIVRQWNSALPDVAL